MGQSCETNTIFGSPRGTGILPVYRNHGQDAHATIPPDGGTTTLAPGQGAIVQNEPNSEGEPCETKPIPPRRADPTERSRTDGACGWGLGLEFHKIGLHWASLVP